MTEQSEFELLGHVTVGQYLPTGSVVHSLDPRAKLLMVLLMICAVVISKSLLGLSLVLLAVVIGLRIARIPLRFSVAGLRPMLPFLLILALLQVFAIPQYSGDASLIWRWGFLTMTDRSLLAGSLLIARFTIMFLGLSLFSFSTTTTELTHGIEHLLRPLQTLRLPAHELALMVNITIRFLPILAEETERLMKAQASRGADLSRSQRNPIRRARLMLPLLVPLFLISLRRAEELIEAMEARCYLGGKGRSHLIWLRARAFDFVALLGAVALATIVIYLHRIDADRLAWSWIAVHL